MTKRGVIHLSVLVIILVALLVIGWLTFGFGWDMLDLISDNPFLSTLFAGLTLLAISSGLLPPFLRSLKRPNIEVVVSGDSEALQLTRSEGGRRAEGTFQFTLVNHGRDTLSDYYWNLIVPKRLNPKLFSLKEDEEKDAASFQEDFLLFQGLETEPLYPRRAYSFPYQLKMHANPEESDSIIVFFFSTEFGMYPPEVMSSDRTGAVRPEKGLIIPVRNVAKE
ncbi:hypothetical protein AMJ57_02565 [Parcubacteria bacterium SG8_24]|nr:MAG: hypothetical protein AMJ57_02565 [Parcubacteria bacterium SG8_24]